MRLLIDQNIPDSVGTFFEERGHDVSLVREVLGRASPDQLIAVTAELQGVIVVTLDKDFTRFKQLLPEGSRNRFASGTGTIRLAVRESRLVARPRDEIDTIEGYAERALREGKRIHVRLTETTIQRGMSGSGARLIDAPGSPPAPASKPKDRPLRRRPG